MVKLIKMLEESEERKDIREFNKTTKKITHNIYQRYCGENENEQVLSNTTAT